MMQRKGRPDAAWAAPLHRPCDPRDAIKASTGRLAKTRRDLARDLRDPLGHGGALLRRQRGALLPKPGKARMQRSRLGLPPDAIVIAPKLE